VDFELSESQVDLADGMRHLCRVEYSLERVRAFELSDRVVDRQSWRHLGEAGVFNLCLAEEAGGVGQGLAEAVLVFEELGRALVPGPLVATHLAAGLVDGADDGSAVVGLVEVPPANPVLPIVIEDLADLDVLLVLSDSGIASLDPTALLADGAERKRRPMDPLSPVWSLATLPQGEPIAGPDIAAWWRRDGAVLTAALQIGLASWTTDLAVEYAKQRRQFGRPIGGFQAVKHLCADMAVRTELARCSVQAAAVTVDQPGVGDADVAALGAKLLADEAAITNGRSCIQVHGGMGFTWEVPAHLAYKRARILASQFGTDDSLAETLGMSIADNGAVTPTGSVRSLGSAS
jgi:alkylation response protein AidB-like acyl-CoA dehydrogenase